MFDTRLSERQKRELEFYEEFSRRNEPTEICFDMITGQESRPWNSYWRVAEIVKSHFHSPDQRLLDLGCGKGENSIVFSRIGYEVYGFDLSPNNIAIAERLARKYGVEKKTHFSIGVAERFGYEDGFFDLVAGIDILHHVTISHALSECMRVLKRGGRAIFHEPVRIPVLDGLRETKLMRWLVPKEASLDRQITHDERKLNGSDIEEIRGFDPGLEIEGFRLVSRLDRLIRDPNSPNPSLLERLDHRLFARFPSLKAYGGVVVMVLTKA